MKDHPPARSSMETILARVLYYGTWLASVLIAFGFTLMWIDAQWDTHAWAGLPDQEYVTLGIGLFILLPVLRVTVMLVMFLKQRDYHFVAISAMVLLIIILSYLLGKHTASAA
jgi:uncharacterized membrane protein